MRISAGSAEVYFERLYILTISRSDNTPPMIFAGKATVNPILASVVGALVAYLTQTRPDSLPSPPCCQLSCDLRTRCRSKSIFFGLKTGASRNHRHARRFPDLTSAVRISTIAVSLANEATSISTGTSSFVDRWIGCLLTIDRRAPIAS
jgi:hypothetical protein